MVGMSLDDDPRILETGTVVAFGPTSVLGRRALATFTVDGAAYCCLEQYFTAETARALGDADARAQVLASSSPAEHSRLGRRIEAADTRSWDDRLECMDRGNMARLEQILDVAIALAATGHKQLHEAGARGVGLAVDDPRIAEPEQWRGENLLGWSLMHVRRDAQGIVELAELRAASSSAVVRRVLERVASFKHACAVLAERPPDPAASELLIAAYREGRAAAWLTACLLGRLRVPASAPVLLEILRTAPADIEPYAGVALARVAGGAARDDLLDLLGGRHRRCREAARHGLVELKDRTIVPDLIAGVRSDRITIRSAAHILARLDLPILDVITWLGSAEVFERTLGARVVEALLEQPEVTLDPALVEAARAALELPLDLPLVIDRYLRRRLAPPAGA